jgi:SAM-dependent methyltransferase
MAEMARPDLPQIADARMLADWLTGPRSRALRRAGIGLANSVLEVGCGHCVVTEELLRRARGLVVCLDRQAEPMRAAPEQALAVCGDAHGLPFTDAVFDLVFFQNVLLWVDDIERVIGEACRTLRAGGALVALEPDYGGMMEHPDLGLRELWLGALQRTGADPLAGRKLAGACERAGLQVWLELAHLPQKANHRVVRLLDDLPLQPDERGRAYNAAAALREREDSWQQFVHVPYFLLVATKSDAD